MENEKKSGGIIGLIMDSFGKIVTSEKFLDFISQSDLSELAAVAMQSPYAPAILDKVKRMGHELRERYNINDWKYYVDHENNAFIVELDIPTHDLRKDFTERFHDFLKALREKTGKGFDLFAKLYQIQRIRCVERDEKVMIDISTQRVEDLHKTLLVFSKADVKYGGEEGYE